MSKPPMEWSAILADAVSKPGIISEAYSRFWAYSPGNQLLALFQCFSRGIEPGPLNTFRGWQKLGRWIIKGEKSLTLCMPVTRSIPPEASKLRGEHSEEPPVPRVITGFIYRAGWFVLSQTGGNEYVPRPIPAWNETLSLQKLGIQIVPFSHLDGNVQGYAFGRSVAVSPIAFFPERTRFHEVAHIVLGHTADRGRLEDDNEQTPRHIREVEAECVALICCESLSLGGAPFSRGYIQHWLRGATIPDKSIHHIFKAADLILRAGRPETRHDSFEGGA